MITNRKNWYETDYILHQIRPQLVNKYLSVRKKGKGKKFILSRYYMGYSIDLLKKSLERNNVLNDDSAKIYFDLATWQKDDGTTPIFSYDKSQRKKQKEDFSDKGEWKNCIQSYDFAIDFDSKKIMVAWKECKKVKEVFDEYKLPYTLRFSGTKGFHLVIDSKWIKTRFKPIKRAELFGKVVNNIMNDLRLKTIDMSIYDPRRILKLAYSLCNNDGEEYVCLPLNDSQFDLFKIENMRMDNVLRNIRLFNRGLLERNHNLSEKELILNTSRFIKEYRK